MKTTAILALLLLGLASAARMPELAVMEDELPESLVSMQDGASVQLTGENAPIELEGGLMAGSYAANMEALLSEPELQKKEKWPIRIATKHLVRPAMHGQFVRMFWRLQAKSKDIKGLRYLSLGKTAGDNIVWTSYAVYEDFAALIKHARSEAVRDFAIYLTTTNIPVSSKLLIRIAGGYHGDENKALATADNKKHGWPVRLLTAYIVRPGHHCAFVKAWEKMERKIGGSKGNIALSLNKPIGDNLVFVSYAAWESHEDLWDAVQSKAVRNFIEYIKDEGITEVTKRLFKIPAPKW